MPGKARRCLWFLVILFILPALACGEYPGVPRQFAGGTGGGAGLPPATGGSGQGSGGNQVFSGGEAEIELRDFEIFPADLTISAGEITFTLANRGRFTHDFRIEGEGIDEKSPRVSAGRTDEWSITLSPGVYHISCPISNHADRGMVGTLTVTP